MKYYETVSEALNDLYHKGYTKDFSLMNDIDCIYCKNNDHSLSADEFEIDEVYRFEGNTDPADEMIIYAISSINHSFKGTLLNAFGIYSDSNNSKIIEKLKYHKNNINPPIKRAYELMPLSREHHHSLLLCWKIKMGLQKKIELSRIKLYVEWYFNTYLLPHFEIEEKHLFTLLSETDEKRQKGFKQHLEIKKILYQNNMDENDFIKLQQLLNDHIRFEERVLFNEIQKNYNLKHIVEYLDSHDEKFSDNESDPFWL